MMSAGGSDETRLVVVGVDGSQRNLTAVRWAAHAADQRGARLRLVCVVNEYDVLNPDMHAVPPESWAPAASEQARATATDTCPDLSAEKAIHFGHPGPVLAQEAQHADLLVVGRRGGSRLSERLLGSAALSAVKHSHALTVVVPTAWLPQSQAPVVVGVGLAGGDQVLDVAFSEAQRLGVPLQVLRTWNVRPELGWDTAILYEEFPRWDQEMRHELDELVEPWAAKYPAVDVRQRVEHGDPTVVLREAAAHASLVVVGNHERRFGVPHQKLGSVARSVLHHVTAPVMVVPLP